jgi:hypothetical protein
MRWGAPGTGGTVTTGEGYEKPQDHLTFLGAKSAVRFSLESGETTFRERQGLFALDNLTRGRRRGVRG